MAKLPLDHDVDRNATPSVARSTPHESATDADRVDSAEIDAVLDATGALMGIAARSMSDALESVTLPQYRALALIAGAGTLRPSDLARALAMQPSGVTRLASRLQRDGLLSRRRATGDGRESALTLTPAGEGVVREVTRRRRREITAALSRMSPSERAAAAGGLRLFARAAGEGHHEALLLGWCAPNGGTASPERKPTMSATLRIHRGHGAPERIVFLGRDRIGQLSDPVNDFEVPLGRHVVQLRLGAYHSIAAHFDAHEGDVIEFDVVDDPEAVMPMLLGGAVRLARRLTR